MSISNSSSSWLAKLGCFGFILVIAMGVGAFFLVRYLYRSAALTPFQPSLDLYLTAVPRDKTPTGQPFKPGMIAVDLTTNSLDHFFFELPDNLRAANPESVKTVVFLQWDKKETHKYSNGRPGYTQICMVDVVDLETKTLLMRADFQGSPPPSSIRSRSSSAQGSSPADKVVLFLQQNTPR